MSERHFHRVCTTEGIVPCATAAQALAGGEGYAWLDYCEPTREELTALVAPLGLHPLAIEDCLDQAQIPKIEDYPGNAFILFNSFSYAEGALLTHEVDIFVGPSFVVTVSGRDGSGQPVLGDLRKAVEQEIHSARQGPAFLAHVVLDQVVDRKLATVEAIEEKLGEAEEVILADASGFSPAELIHLRRDLIALRKSLFHEREVMVRICRRDCPYVSEPAVYLYRDLYDHLTKFYELTESSREIVTSLMEMHLSMQNNRMALAANQTNLTVRRLTFITTIFMPLSLLAGVGGMSEWSMMTGPSNWRIAYPAFLAGLAVIGVATYFLLRRTGRSDERSLTPAGTPHEEAPRRQRASRRIR